MTASAIREASCSRGWLRWVVQIFFGMIIVTSFILILLMAITNSRKLVPKPVSRCQVRECRVICKLAPYFDDYESHIVDAVWQADENCESIILILQQPFFTNNTLPQNWLSGARTNVNKLAIVGGNLKHISPCAFISQFSNNIQMLILENIQLTTWGPETFVGLSSLKQLYIKDCMLINITRNALQAVDDTLEFLDIKASFMWDPAYITGSTNLARLNVVDFAKNPFYSILDKSSFTKLRMCTTLFLNSCQITSIGKGTFDYLENIKVLYLNDNHLLTVPSGFFDKILPLKPRIAIHANRWNCDCSDSMFKSLLTSDVLMVDPKCHYPDSVNGLTFSEFNYYCENKSIEGNKTRVDYDKEDDLIENKTYIINPNNGDCHLSLQRIERIRNFWLSILNNATIIHNNDWLSPTYCVRSNYYSMVELSSSSNPDQGLLWYKSSCPSEFYCLNIMPSSLRIFDSKSNVRYAFCPFDTKSGEITVNQCVTYALADIDTHIYLYKYHGTLRFILISIMCAMCGAICIYALIYCNPHLLRGNKRILFVKHKEINALILPPDVPLRKNTLTDCSLTDGQINNIFLVSNQKESISSLDRSFSFKSSKSTNSNDVSYISALQPTDEQLAQWRIKENNRNVQYDSIRSDKLSSVFDTDSLTYYSLKEIYDTPLEMSKK
ncbi:uncharacterized protein LOC119834843 [Zerene cesonia]|uniref:uncharacterized protein LOC119834843 n=1 Tax=Zerene cesonia TaxID=33412 RepID=UPI0018E5A60A|nr:uncharacterized protein LOC119834843 [Zerene cesonia]